MRCELIDYMGSDDRVVDAARVSFDKIAVNFTDDQNHKLLIYLCKHNHWSPFSHVMITMRETVPIFVARQRFKHMVGFTYNEISRRYVDDAPEFYEPSVWRGAPTGNKKQGSSDETIDLRKFWWNGEDGKDEVFGAQDLNTEVAVVMSKIKGLYNSLLKAGVAPEQARMVLPQSMFTSYYVTGSLAAWARAYLLRSDPHAQQEIQDLAAQWNEIISALPELRYSWQALTS